MIKISVIIIVKDEPAIDQTLKELFDQIYGAKTEIIVVDASEGRLSSIRQKHPQVVWLDFHCKNDKKRVTIAEQRNVGVQASIGQVIVFCDAGGSPNLGWLEAITSPILLGDQILVGGPIRATNLSSLDTWTNLQHDGDEIQYPTTANLALTRSAFDLVGGFNEDLDYGSDADLVWRLNSQGIKQICAAKAVMGLDGGSRKRELKRAWRYGKAMTDLLLLHPERRLLKAQGNPEIWIYPALTIVGILALPALDFSEHLAIAFLTANLLLILKNLKLRHPLQILLRHYIYGWGICYRFLSKKLPKIKVSQVLIYPADDIRYLEELFKGLKLIEEEELSVEPFPKLTFSNTLNVLILPIISPFLRIRGAKIIHIHWIYRFNLIWSKGKMSGDLIEYWFKLWISSLKWSGLKIIWTAHNIMPHDPIFMDDFKIRQYLVRSTHIVIALSENAADEIKIKFDAQEIEVIPEGPLFHPTTFSRIDFRDKLQVPAENVLVVSLGSLAPYKGIRDLLEASLSLGNKISIRVAGWCDSREETELKKLYELAKCEGIDIQISFGKLTKNEFGAYLQAADFYAAPFRAITNSGTINAALTAGLPVVIPNLPSVQWIPREASILYAPESPSTTELASAINSLTSISEEQIEAMKSSAKCFTKERSWAEIAEEHISIYQKMARDSRN